MIQKSLFLVLSFLIFAGCSRYVKEVKPIPEDKPKISKTLEQEKQRFLKRKVAIARFSNETNYGKGFFYDGKNDRIAKQAMDILSAKLTETEKFILLERSDLEEINKELELGGLNKLNIPADYLIVGSVSEFGRNTTSDVGVFSRTKKQTAKAKVYLRLVDISTSQIIYSEEGEGEATSEDGTVFGVGSRAGYNSALNDKAISVAISKLVSNVVSNLLDKPWRSYILDYDNGNYLISGGDSQGILADDEFDVFEKGKSVKNPQTNMLIELPGKKIGKIKVVSTSGNTPNNEVSFCIKIEGKVPIDNFTNVYVQEIN
jgi:curli biogenesis system outer membrane secretion channel CsgG